MEPKMNPNTFPPQKPKQLVIGCLEMLTQTGEYFGCQQEGLVDTIANSINDHSLDIFLAPEWLFLPKNRIYSTQEKEGLTSELAEKTSKTNSLILPGTFMWEINGKVVNSTPIITHGRLIREYTKRFDGGTEDIARQYGFRKVQYGKKYGTAFRWNNLNIGIEICLDHASGCLTINPSINDLDLQIVLSCGMSLCNNQLTKLKTEGYGILCDGFFPESAVKKKMTKDVYTQQAPAEKIPLQNGTQLSLYELEV
ncbi:hypothetical protein HY643_04250 [Candidatus Woesearchaeota archaeon]|nr:hypothetical protein [Candidatus Woesearchaeota archaeon]